MFKFTIRSLFPTMLLLSLSACAGAAATQPPTETPAPTVTPSPTPVPPTATEPPPFILDSASFGAGEEIPTRHIYAYGSQCDGENYSPELSWSGEPAGTETYTLTMIDSGYVHWIQFNIPAETHLLEEAIGGPEVGVKALNLFGEFGYSGPCPISGTRTYVFTLYALDTTLDIHPASTIGQVESAMEGHILGETEFTAVRTRESASR